MAWHVNDGLAVLLIQVRYAHPKIVIGTVGDLSHQARKSDHNPNSAGRVNAADFMLGPAFKRVDAVDLVSRLIKDNRSKYVIFEGRIWEGGIWRKHTGPDPHNDHIHLSVYDSAYRDLRKWEITTPEPRKVEMVKIDGELPVLKLGDHDPVPGVKTHYIMRLQKMIGVYPDGVYGPDTSKAVANYWFKQRGKKIDGKTVTLEIWRDLYGIW